MREEGPPLAVLAGGRGKGRKVVVKQIEIERNAFVYDSQSVLHVCVCVCKFNRLTCTKPSCLSVHLYQRPWR